MNNALKQLTLISVLTFSSFSLTAAPNDAQNNTQEDSQTPATTIMVPVINPNTGKIEAYVRCEEAPDCERPPIMIQNLEEND